MDNGQAVLGREESPKGGSPPSVYFGGDEDDAALGFFAQGDCERAHLIGCVHNWRVEDVDGVIRNSLVEKDQAIVGFFSSVGNGIPLQCGSWFDGVGKPDLWGVTLIVKPGGFQSSIGHPAAEHGEGSGFLQGILAVQPAAEIQKGQQGEEKQGA